MPLTLNQFLLLILTLAAVVFVVFLVMFIAQLRRTAAEGEKTLAEVRKLVVNLNDLEKDIKAKLGDLGQIMEASKKTVVNLSEASLFLTTRVVQPASRYWPFIYPIISFLWKNLRKRKERKHGR